MKEEGSSENVCSSIREYAKREGCVPTVREICEATGLKSTCSAQSKISSLIKLGILESRKGKFPAYRLKGYKLVKM